MWLIALLICIVRPIITAMATLMPVLAIMPVDPAPVLVMRIHRIVHDPKVVLRMLQVRFRKYPVPRRLRVAR
jgi:hypothetical protein